MFKYITAAIACLFLSISLALVPMDQPAHSRAEFVFPSNVELEKKREYFGLFLASLPTEILIPFFKGSNIATKKGLRQTNKFFSKLFSWHAVHPFMLCKELNASANDILSLIIQCMHKPNKSENENDFIKHYEERFFSYQILGEPYFLALEFVGDNNEKKPDLYLFNNITRKKTNIPPLLEVCLARNATMVETYLNSVSPQEFSIKKGLPINTFCQALQILVQNDDALSLERVLNNKKVSQEYKRVALSRSCSRLIQATLVCASPKVIRYLLPPYQAKNLSDLSGGDCKEKDWIGKMLTIDPAQINSKGKKDFILNTLTIYHPMLLERHKSDPSNYYLVLNLLLNEKRLNKLLNQNKCQSPKNPSHNKCLLM